LGGKLLTTAYEAVPETMQLSTSTTASPTAPRHRDAFEFDHLPPLLFPPGYRPRRPLGVGVVSLLVGSFGTVLVLSGILANLVAYGGPLVPASLSIVGSTDAVVNGILAGVGAVLIVVATGLWRQEEWALYTLSGLALAGMIYLLLVGSVTLLFLLLLILGLYLLFVRRYFV
jgi:hypothetical protein